MTKRHTVMCCPPLLIFCLWSWIHCMDYLAVKIVRGIPISIYFSEGLPDQSGLMARITRFLSLRKQFILNRSNVRFATIQVPDPTKIVGKENSENSTPNENRNRFPTSVDSFISWSKSSKSTKKDSGFLKAKKRSNKNQSDEVIFYEAQPKKDKDKFLLSADWKEFRKIINEFKPNNYCTLSLADRRKGTRSQNFFFIDRSFCSGKWHHSVTLGTGLKYIRVWHLVLGCGTLQCDTWSRGKDIRVWHFSMSVLILNFKWQSVTLLPPWTKCHTLVFNNPRSNVTL